MRAMQMSGMQMSVMQMKLMGVQEGWRVKDFLKNIIGQRLWISAAATEKF